MTNNKGRATQVEVEETKICSSKLRTLTPLLKLRTVHAGDVLLTRGRNLEARVIAKLSGGEYSHAALWLPRPHEGSSLSRGPRPALHLVEADDFGVGSTELRTMFLHLPAKEIEPVAQLPGDVEKAMLLRHRARTD